MSGGAAAGGGGGEGSARLDGRWVNSDPDGVGSAEQVTTDPEKPCGGIESSAAATAWPGHDDAWFARFRVPVELGGHRAQDHGPAIPAHQPPGQSRAAHSTGTLTSAAVQAAA